MGDRAQVTFRFSGNIQAKPGSGQDIVLYSHWSGYHLAECTQAALIAGRPRWGDESYLCRFMVSQIIPADAHQDVLSWGLAPTYQDNDGYPDLIVSLTDNRIRIGGEYLWTFEQFALLEPATINAVWRDDN